MYKTIYMILVVIVWIWVFTNFNSLFNLNASIHLIWVLKYNFITFPVYRLYWENSVGRGTNQKILED